MIIYGWRTLESQLGSGMFRCPECRTQQGFRHLSRTRWFTLYFLPVFPLGSESQQVECQGCYCRFGTHLLGAVEMPGGDPFAPRAAYNPGPVPLPLAAPPIATPSGPPLASAPPPAGPQTSGWAIASLVSGLVSPLLLCILGFSLFSSLFAVIAGHLALHQIGKSNQRLGGRAPAIAGLVLGYLLLAVSIVFWLRMGPIVYAILQNDQPPAARATSDSDRLHAAELEVIAPGDEGGATGNTPAAQALADEYATSLFVMRTLLFTKDRERISLSRGHFVVHCEQHSDRCAFIVHVPSYRDFTPSAKADLAKLAWELAQNVVKEEQRPGDKLAVGLRGTLLYGAIMVGQVGDKSPIEDDAEREALLAFFTPPGPELEAPVVAVTTAPANRPAESESPFVEVPASAPRVAVSPAPTAGKAPEKSQLPPGGLRFQPGVPATAGGPSSPPPRGPNVPPQPMEKAKTASAPTPDGPPMPKRPPLSLDQIVAALQSGDQSFGRLYLPLSDLRRITPDPARHEEVAALLDPLLRADSPSIRNAAYRAVEVWGTPRNVPTLVAALDSADRSDRGNAIDALGKVGGSPEVATRLAEILQNSSEASDGLRAARALEALGALAEDPVLPLVGHRDNRVHSSACQILVKAGTAKSLDKLKALPKESSTSRQIHIDRAIREIQRRVK